MIVKKRERESVSKREGEREVEDKGIGGERGGEYHGAHVRVGQ